MGDSVACADACVLLIVATQQQELWFGKLKHRFSYSHWCIDWGKVTLYKFFSN